MNGMIAAAALLWAALLLVLIGVARAYPDPAVRARAERLLALLLRRGRRGR